MKSIRIVRSALAAATVVSLVAFGAPFAALADTPGVFLTFNVFTGPPGTVVNATGSNFTPGETVNIGFGNATTTAVASTTSNFIVPLTVPSLTTGPALVTAIGQSSGFVATNSFFVEPASSTASTTPPTGGPSLAIISGPANNSTTSQQSVTFAFTTDPGATTACSFDVTGAPTPSIFACGSPVTLGSTTSSTTLPLGDGPYTFRVTATNASSTASTTQTVNFTVDTSAPVIATTTPTPTPTPAPAPASGGGGGGGYVASGPLSIGYVNTSQAPAAAPPANTGVVLGTSTISYTFTHPLTVGSRGADVTALQTILIAGGYLLIDAPTGYFGTLTRAAVKAYQQAHGLEQVGNVGPLTRAALNAGK